MTRPGPLLQSKSSDEFLVRQIFSVKLIRGSLKSPKKKHLSFNLQ